MKTFEEFNYSPIKEVVESPTQRQDLSNKSKTIVLSSIKMLSKEYNNIIKEISSGYPKDDYKLINSIKKLESVLTSISSNINSIGR